MNYLMYNKNLNPIFWSETKTLSDEVRESLLNISETFYADIEFKVPIEDVYFLGSSANYNWTSASDIDLHLLIDFNKLNMPKEDARKYTSTLAKKWNLENDITVKGHNVEVYIQDISEENHSTGIYSLKTNEWIKEATPEHVEIDKSLIKEKYSQWAAKINDAIKTKDLDKLKKTMKGLTKMRQTGLDKAGEYSTENIVFKMLRHQQVINKLKNALQTIKNKESSLDDAYDPTSFGPNPSATIGVPLFSDENSFDKDFYQRHIRTMQKI